MSALFDSLENRLLRGGIAYRHVRRYLHELGEHLSDITDAQIAAGRDAPTASARARAALGRDDELVDAMLKRHEFRSLSARFPWLVFGVLPVIVLSLAVPCHILLVVISKKLIAPVLFSTLPEALSLIGNFIVVPAIVLLFVRIAHRQRCSLVWPILSSIVVLLLSPHWDNHPAGEFSSGFSALHLLYRDSGEEFRGGFTPLFLSAWWQVMAVQWAAFAAQYLLTLLPLTWLVRRHRKPEAVA